MDEAEGVTDILRRHIIPHVRIFKLYHSEAWSEWNKKQEILCFEESKWLKSKCEDLASPDAGVQADSTYGSALSWLQVTSEEPGVTPHWPSRPGPASAELQQVTTTQQLPPDLSESDTWHMGAVMMIACLTQTVGVVNKMNAIRMIKLLLKESDGWLIVKVMPRKDL